MLAGASLLQFSLAFAKPPKAFWFFASYLAMSAGISIFVYDNVDAVTGGDAFMVFQNLILFWISYNLLRDPAPPGTRCSV